MLQNKLPGGFMPALTTSNGDCLFDSVSVCLFGTCVHELLLRFSAVVQGVTHFDHYVELVSSLCLLLLVCYNLFF